MYRHGRSLTAQKPPQRRQEQREIKHKKPQRMNQTPATRTVSAGAPQEATSATLGCLMGAWDPKHGYACRGRRRGRGCDAANVGPCLLSRAPGDPARPMYLRAPTLWIISIFGATGSSLSFSVVRVDWVVRRGFGPFYVAFKTPTTSPSIFTLLAPIPSYSHRNHNFYRLTRAPDCHAFSAAAEADDCIKYIRTPSGGGRKS